MRSCGLRLQVFISGARHGNLAVICDLTENSWEKMQSLSSLHRQPQEMPLKCWHDVTTCMKCMSNANIRLPFAELLWWDWILCVWIDVVILLYYFRFSFKQKQTFLSSSKTVLNPDASCSKKYYIHTKVKKKTHGSLSKTGVFLQPWRGFMKGSAHWEMCNRLQKCWFSFPYQVRVDCRIYGCLTRETNHQSSQRGDNAHPLQISAATEQFSSKEWLTLWVWLKKKSDSKVN